MQIYLCVFKEPQQKVVVKRAQLLHQQLPTQYQVFREEMFIAAAAMPIVAE